MPWATTAIRSDPRNSRFDDIILDAYSSSLRLENFKLFDCDEDMSSSWVSSTKKCGSTSALSSLCLSFFCLLTSWLMDSKNSWTCWSRIPMSLLLTYRKNLRPMYLRSSIRQKMGETIKLTMIMATIDMIMVSWV